MPRKAKSAAAAGLPGTPSGNRTDLAVTTPTGMPYGEAGRLQAGQAQVPMANPSPPLPAPGAAPGGPGPMLGGATGPSGPSPVPPAGGLAAVLQAAMANSPPAGPGLGSQPSARPNEPVTAGLPSGPGPGPEALTTSVDTPGPTASVLATAARTTGSALLAQLAQSAAEAGQ